MRRENVKIIPFYLQLSVIVSLPLSALAKATLFTGKSNTSSLPFCSVPSILQIALRSSTYSARKIIIQEKERGEKGRESTYIFVCIVVSYIEKQTQ
ncbi:hypothetical protein GGR58DRAFT_454060 [Xylaria digitata]|nr:hypothetical protein GGR58DRAFT_454060 [Xylaria digitata]